MQHGLLALAIALILAIVAALFAPAYVDWNEWRATFERQAGDLAGAPVRIRGPIEATILPTPQFILRDVRIGDPEKSTGIEAGEVRGTLALGALLRGAFEAEEFVLVKPSIRLALEQGGRIILPEGRTSAPDELAISRFSMNGGSLTLDDRANGNLVFFDNISANGELRSRTGPMKLDASMRHDGRGWVLRATTGVFGADGAARSRLQIERPDDGLLLDADGFLGFSSAAPRFSGKVNFAQSKIALPWKIAANGAATGDLVAFDAVELSVGGNETPLELAGNLQFVPRKGGKIEGALSAKRLDLDRVLGVKPGEGLAPLVALLRDSLGGAAGLPFAGKISVTTDLVAANGAQARDVRAEIGLRQGFLGVENIEAKLPGRAVLSAKGSSAARGYFLGDFSLEAEDPATLIRWSLGPDKSDGFGDGEMLRLAGRADWSPETISVEKLEFALGESKFGGGFSLAQNGSRAALKTALTASNIDLDLLSPLAQAFWSGSKESDIAFAFQGRGLKLFGKELKGIDAAITRNANGISFERLTIEDFDGLSGKATGKIAGADDRIEFALDAVRAGGIAAIAKHFGGQDLEAMAQTISAKGMPLKMSGTASGEKIVLIEAKGKFADVSANLTARLEEKSLADSRIIFETSESGKLLSLLGISPGPPAPGDGRLEISLARPRYGIFPLQASLSVPGADLSAAGEIEKKENRLEPRLDLKLQASDLRPGLAAASRMSGDGAIPATGSAKFVRSSEGFSLENLSLEVGKSIAAGQIALSNLDKPSFSGRLSFDRMELSNLLALAVGGSDDTKSFWPATKLNAAPFSGAFGSVDFEIATLNLAGAQVASGAKFKLKLGNETEIANFTADYAGGKLSGDGKIARGDALSLDGRLALTGFDVARVLAPGTPKANARGKGNLTLSLTGSGATPAALAAKFSGQGTLSLESLEIDALDPLTIATVISAADKHMPKDEGHLIEGVNKMLARAPLILPKLEAPVIVVNGSARTGKAMAKVGDVAIAAEANFDLARLRVDGSVDMETPGSVSVRPGLTIRWSGPVSSPSRSVDVSALSTAINLRAMERETKRIEQRDRSALPAEKGASAAR